MNPDPQFSLTSFNNPFMRKGRIYTTQGRAQSRNMQLTFRCLILQCNKLRPSWWSLWSAASSRCATSIFWGKHTAVSMQPGLSLHTQGALEGRGLPALLRRGAALWGTSRSTQLTWCNPRGRNQTNLRCLKAGSTKKKGKDTAKRCNNWNKPKKYPPFFNFLFFFAKN